MYGVKIKPSVLYDLRGLAAGQASCIENRIRLNRKLLEKYGADSLTIAMTTKILDDLSIKTNLNKGKNGKDTLPDNAINNTITINIIIVYIAAGILILLLITTSYLLLRKSKNLKVHT